MAASGLSCSSKFAKYFLFFFNIIFWVAGGVVLGVGIWVLADPNATKILHIATLDANDGLVKGAAATLIIVGAIIFLTGFLGCCGAIRENSCMLLMYASIVGFVLVLQIIAGILAAVFKDQIKNELDKSLTTTVQEKYGSSDKAATDGMDILQRMFKCCGVNNASEWKTSEWYKSHQGTVPVTCCALKNQEKLNEPAKPVNDTLCYQLAEGTQANFTGKTSDYVFLQGCQDSLQDWINDHAGILIGVAFGLAAVQLFGVILACCLRNRIKSAYEYV